MKIEKGKLYLNTGRSWIMTKTLWNKEHFIKCDVCGEKPFDIFFDSTSWNLAYHCKSCDPNNAKVGVLKSGLRLLKRILGIEQGFTC